MTTQQQAHPTTVGPITLLTILFVGLKLTGYIDWSWWWVLSPLWIPVSTILAVGLLILLGSALVSAVIHEPKSQR